MNGRKSFVFILLLSVLLFSANLWGLSVFILDEAKNSSCAREMLERADFIIPTFNYHLRTDKPPLHYFFMMLSYTIFGINEFGARFFSAICGIGTTLSIFIFVKKFIDEKTAFWSSIIFLSAIQVITQFHQAVPDPYLVFLFTLSMFLLYQFYQERKLAGLYTAYALLGLGLLTKGPVALLLPALILFLFLIAEKKLRKDFWAFKPFTGLLIALVIAVPWYLAVGLATDWEWTRGFFLTHNINRFSEPMEGHGGPFFIIPVFMIWGLFPFSIFIIQAAVFSRRQKQNLVKYSWFIILTIAVFFSISGTKLPNYPAPSFPFLAIVLGYFVARANFGERNFRINWSLAFHLLIAIALPVGLYVGLDKFLQLPQYKWLAFLFLILPAGTILAIIFNNRKKMSWSFGALAGSWLIMILLFYYVVFPPLDRQNPVPQAMKHIDPSKPVLYYVRYNPAFSFYLKKPISEVDSLGLTTLRDAYVLSRLDKLTTADTTSTNIHLISADKELFEPHTSVLLYADEKAGVQSEKR